MPKIFISYRRADSSATVGRIYDKLAPIFGKDNVFIDVDDVPKGKDFRKVLEDEAASCDVMLVVIGPKWTSITDDKGQVRIKDPEDYVRFEVEKGLKRDVVIPILVEGASMPTPADLDESLQELAFKNAAVIQGGMAFHNDMNLLIQDIRVRHGRRITRGRLLTAAGIAGIILLLLAGMIFAQSGQQPTEITPEPSESIADETATPSSTHTDEPSLTPTEEITATFTRTSSPTPAQQAANWSIGTILRPIQNNIWLRDQHNADIPPILILSQSARLRILEAVPYFDGKYNQWWWKVSTSEGVIGWMEQQYMEYPPAPPAFVPTNPPAIQATTVPASPTVAAAAICGDGDCDESRESSFTCSADCGPPGPFCGDGECEDSEEGICSADCRPSGP